MNIDFVKQKYAEGQNTEYTHMLILEDIKSNNMFCIYLNKDNITFEVLCNFLNEKIYDYIILYSLRHNIDEQLQRVNDELCSIEDRKKSENVKLENPMLRLFI